MIKLQSISFSIFRVISKLEVLYCRYCCIVKLYVYKFSISYCYIVVLCIVSLQVLLHLKCSMSINLFIKKKFGLAQYVKLYLYPGCARMCLLIL